MRIPKDQIETNKEQKRSKIIDSAALLFSRKPYHEVMMTDVAKLSDIAKGTIYNYFPSKEDLYFSIMLLRMGKLKDGLKEKIKGEIDSIGALHSFIIHLYMFMMKYQNFFLMYRKETLKNENELCSELLLMQNELKALLIEILDTGIKENIYKSIDEELTADLILGSIYGAVGRGIEKIYTDEQMNCDREKLFDFIYEGISAGNNSSLPLIGKRLVLTRTIAQLKGTSELFKKLGANVINFPAIEVLPPEDWTEFDNAISDIENYDYLIFTSAHSVEMFSKRISGLNIIPPFSKIKVIALGNKTKGACSRYEMPVDYIPQKFSSKDLIEELSLLDLAGKKIFIPRSEIGRDELPEGLTGLGADVKIVPVYRVSLPSNEVIAGSLEKLNAAEPDLFIFTSPSTFENLIEILKLGNPDEYFSKYKIAVIGPTTKEAVESRGVNVDIIPSEYTMEGLADAIVKFYKTEREKS